MTFEISMNILHSNCNPQKMRVVSLTDLKNALWDLIRCQNDFVNMKRSLGIAEAYISCQ